MAAFDGSGSCGIVDGSTGAAGSELCGVVTASLFTEVFVCVGITIVVVRECDGVGATVGEALTLAAGVTEGAGVEETEPTDPEETGASE